MLTPDELERRNAWVEEILDELGRATEKHPRPFNSRHEGWAVLFEEVDELWDEVKANNHEKAQEEAVQVAAMALRFLVDCCSWPRPRVVIQWTK